MKKKITIIITILVITIILGLCIFLALNKGDNRSKKNNSNNITTKEDLYDEDESIEWGDYDSNDITLDKSLKISKGGVYNLTGTIEDGYILIDTDEDVKLVLNNVKITNSNGPAILVTSANLVEIELVGENYLEDGKTYSSSNTDYDATIYSKADLVFSGFGSLTVKANLADAIVSKDNLKINSGTYAITSVDDAIKGKDSVYIVDGNFTIKAAGDGIKATNDEDEELGYIYIENGTFDINATGDGMDAVSTIKINNGQYTIETEDDGIHADGYLEINNGKLDIDAVEGLEATYIKINDGEISIKASDDGINASNKSDKYQVLVEINGGNITVNMGQGDTDGVDSNGDIIINGGTISVTGQSTFDYDGEGTINGGTIICNGSTVTALPNQFGGGEPGGNMQPPQGGPGRGNR